MLSEDAARAVEGEILPRAGSWTRAELRDRLGRAVKAADPKGAEQRRKDAERQARVSLYADQDGTATLTGSSLPAIQAAAAMARITAIARAMKAAGQAGGLDLHRAQVMIGLILGTLPTIPPPHGAPPDQPPPDDGDEPGDAGDPGDPDRGGPGEGGPGDDGPGDSDRGDGGPWDELPAPRDADAPPDDGVDDAPRDDEEESWYDGQEDDDLDGAGPVSAWPELGVIPPALARRPAQPDGRPVPGLLDAVVPWATLAGLAERPGTLGRIGSITPGQARQLARAARADPAAQWRVIVTNGDGQAVAVTDAAGPATARRSPATRLRRGPGWSAA